MIIKAAENGKIRRQSSPMQPPNETTPERHSQRMSGRPTEWRAISEAAVTGESVVRERFDGIKVMAEGQYFVSVLVW